MADFRFTNEYLPSQQGAMDVLSQPRLWVPGEDYPDYFEWLLRVENQLVESQKRAMVAFAGQEAIGAIVYQRHTQRASCIEIKNISVQPSMRGRYVGSFLLRNTELEALTNDFPDCSSLVVDTKITNIDMISFLLRHGYTLTEIGDLYQLGAGEDAVLQKVYI